MSTDIEPLPRPDWRESVSNAADLALLGVVVTLACLPVVTAGAALTGATTAVDQLCRTRSLPGPRQILATAGRGFGAGLVVTAITLAAVAVFAADLWLLNTGAIPGATPMAIALGIVGLGLIAVAGVTVVRVGQTDGRGWRAAARWSTARLKSRPHLGVAVLATIALPVLLATSIPVTSLLLPGFLLFGLHAVVRRLA